MMTLEQLFEGNQNFRGVLGSIVNGSKKAWQDPQPFDWEKHLRGEQPQGLSPVNIETGECRWICLDIDLKIKPAEFCGNIFAYIGPQYFCFRTMGGKWRVVEFLDDWIGVEEAKDRAKKLQTLVEKTLDYKCDSGHTLPQSYDLENNKPGAWIFLPYHNDETCCYSPGGLALTKSQCEFRARYKNHALIVSAVGMKGGSEGHSRAKALFSSALLNKHYNLGLDLLELSQNFGVTYTETYGEKEAQREMDHALKQAEKYDKEFLIKGTSKWVAENCGVKPVISAKAFSEAVDVLTAKYYYVRNRGDFFEKETYLFVDKVRLNDWWLHVTGRKNTMAGKLLSDPNMEKIHGYFTHAGLPPGINMVKGWDIPGIEPGEYLNCYRGSDVESKEGDVTKLNEYYVWLVGETNWNILKQFMAYMLVHPGQKILWCPTIISKEQGVGKGTLAQLLCNLLGTRNASPNVTFRDLVREHSTIVDGKQFICLNEVMLEGSGKEGKVLSEKFKPYVTDPTLIINPKGKPEIEIPNLCNFMMFSNAEKPMRISPQDRRLFVINIKHTKDKVQRKLYDDGYRDIIMNDIKHPEAFKFHLVNEIGPNLDLDIFQKDAPMTKDKEELIERNKGTFEKLMEEAYESLTFPFCNKTYGDGTVYAYCGLVVRDDFYEAINHDPKFRTREVYFTLEILEDWIKDHAKPFKNGMIKKQINASSGRRQTYIIHNFKQPDDIRLSHLTEGQLGKKYDTHQYKPKDTYETQSTGHSDAELYDSDEQDSDFVRYRNHCWACKTENEKGKYEPTPIDSDNCALCDECEYSYKCNKCGECACDKPDSNIKKKNFY